MKSPQAFRSIGEVARLVGVATHVLRYWETQFPALAPVRRPDGRRYYRADDLLLAAGLCEVMREDGLTIRGAQRLIALDKGAALRERGRLRLEAAAERKTAEAAGRQRAGAGRRTSAPRDKDHAAARGQGRAGHGAAIPAAPRPDGPGAGCGTGGPALVASMACPGHAPSAPTPATAGGPVPGKAPDPSAPGGQPGWLGRLNATAAALRARKHPLPADARPLHDALRRIQNGLP